MLRSLLGRKAWLLSAVGVLSLSALLLWGCGSFGGKKGKPSASVPFQPVSLGSGSPTGRGMLSVRVNLTRAIPEVSRVSVIVLGEGLTEEPLTGDIFVPQETSTTFKNVPVGLKWVIVGAFSLSGQILGLSAKAVVVQDGMQTTATLNLSLSQRVVDINEKVSNATTITEFGTPAPIELRRSNGTIGFYSNNFAPPKIQPVTTLWHGYQTPTGVTFRFDPPVTYIRNEADPSQPLNAGEFQPGQTLTTATTLKKVGDPAFSESQTATVRFLSWQAAFWLTAFGSPEPVSQAAYRLVRVQGTTNPLQWVEWLKRGFGPVIRLDIDPNATVGDGTVPTRIWIAHAPPGPSFIELTGLFFPLEIGKNRLYTVSPGTGAGDINVTVDLPFGLVACDADPDAGAVSVRYSLPVKLVPATDADSALNLANYTLFVGATQLNLAGAGTEAFDPQTIVIQGLAGKLTPGADLKVVVRNVKTADGTKTIPDPNGTTRDDPDDPNVCVTKIRPTFFRLAFVDAFDDPARAVVIAFNRPVDPTTALNKANYRLESPPGTVIDLSLPSVVLEIDPFDPRRVIVEGVQLTAGNLFILTVTGVKDDRGNTIPNDGINNRFKGTVQSTQRRIVIASVFAGDDGTVFIDFGPFGGFFTVNLLPSVAENKANYTVESPLGTTLDLTPATVTVTQVDRDTVRISGLTLTAGNLLRVTVRNLRTQDNIPLLEDGVHNVAKVTVRDVTPPRIAIARFFTTAPHVELTFNEPLDVNSARNRFNYSVRATDNSEFPNVTDATYDGTTVKLTLDSDLTAGKEYEVTANVRDLAGNFGSSSATGTAGTRAARVRSLR
ncbi:MAG: hypothetical protein OXFUSZZB_001434 [Candidatus Fervidibacter sp.]